MGDWGFWIAAGGMCLAVAASLIAALFQRRDTALPAGAYDVQVYRAQLAEVDRDASSGLITSADADRLRTEISRRLIEADRMGRGVAITDSPIGRRIGAVLIAFIMAGAVWGYARLGAPGYSDLPLAARLAAAETFRATRPTQAMAEAKAPQAEPVTPDAEMAALMVKLRAAVQSRPNDVQGLALLARNEAALGNLAAATTAQTALIAAKGTAAAGSDHAMLAELLIRQTDGYVSPEAEMALITALQMDPANGAARYYSGLMFAQGDRADRAFAVWQPLLDASQPDDPWVAPIRLQIAEMAARAGIKYQLPDLAGPTAQQVNDAAGMTSEDQLVMIQSMVDGLSARLATDGGPVEDWARLITSLGLLGDKDQARAIYTEAQGAFAGLTAELDILHTAAAAAGVSE